MPRYKMIDRARSKQRNRLKKYHHKQALYGLIRKRIRNEEQRRFGGTSITRLLDLPSLTGEVSHPGKRIFRAKRSRGRAVPYRKPRRWITNPGQSPWQWGVHAWHKPKNGVSAMHHPAWRKFIRWINEGDRNNQHINLKVNTNRTMTISGVFKDKSRAIGFAHHVEALPGATKLSYENRER
jgi:hypothetical protein